MKPLKFISAYLLVTALCLGVSGCAQKSDQSETTAIPYPLDTCIVSDDTLGADASMETYTFVHEGQEIKLCCKGCLKDFNKEPEKYLAKLTQPVEPALPE